MYQLARHWPKTATPIPAPTFDAGVAACASSPPTEFPDPTRRLRRRRLLRQLRHQRRRPWWTATMPHWDANGDAKLYVEAPGQGQRTAPRASRPCRAHLRGAPRSRRASPSTTAATWIATASGNNPKSPSTTRAATDVSGCVAGSVDQHSRVFGSGIDPMSPARTSRHSTSWIPDTTINQVISMAKGAGRYYDVTAGDPMPTPPRTFRVSA